MNRSGVASAIFLYFLNQKFSLSFTVIPLSFKRAVITAPSIDRASARKSFTQLKSEPEEKPAELDLNLEEMFEMFEAADKGKDFDDTVKKVKGEN